MPIYVFRCHNGHLWEDLLPMGGMAESCPTCACAIVIRVIQPGNIKVRHGDRGIHQGRTKTRGPQAGPLIKMGFREGYKSAFARYPGDPKGYVGTKSEAIRRAAQEGKNITFDVNDVLPPE